MIQQERLFALLRSALGGEACNQALFEGMSPETWSALHKMSVRQGVAALVWDGVSQLPSELRPPKKLWIGWSLNTEKIEKRFAHYCRTANQLATLFAEQGISMLQIKGTGLADCYPVSAHREGGDIDIYLFGAYERANRLIQEQGITVNTEDIKHHSFYYQGIPVENHIHFLNIHSFSTDLILEEELLRILDVEREHLQRASNHETPQVLLPPPNFNALFLVRHAIGHFAQEGIVLRHYCDWFCFLQKWGAHINKERFQELMDACQLTPIVSAFTAIVVEKLGLSPEKAPIYSPNPSLQQRMLDDTFTQTIKKCSSKNPVRIFLHKCKKLQQRKWKYDLIYPGQYWHSVKSSIIIHFRHPETILRLK